LIDSFEEISQPNILNKIYVEKIDFLHRMKINEIKINDLGWGWGWGWGWVPTIRFEKESTPLNWNEVRHLHALLAFF
jgi:hypothetical protein